MDLFRRQSDAIKADLNRYGLADWYATLESTLQFALYEKPNGKREAWLSILSALPAGDYAAASVVDGVVTVGLDAQKRAVDFAEFADLLVQMKPWRKGPYQLVDVFLDTEWRSDKKWDRLLPHISSLAGRRVLDVGCGNGYHLWRMSEAGSKLTIGVDPSLFFYCQFQLIKHFVAASPIHLLPVASEDLPPVVSNGFDTVFSMGVLYHRRNPKQHLTELKRCLRPGGELVLETLIYPNDDLAVLVPEERYAKMRNVWSIPSISTLCDWVREAGFENVSCVDINQTSMAEQRQTPWMSFESLADFLDPEDADKTVEGYPAPTRGIVIAQLPG